MLSLTPMTGLPKHRELRQTWQRACQLILDRAPAAEITRQLERALFMDAKLDLRQARTSPSAKPATRVVKGLALNLSV